MSAPSGFGVRAGLVGPQGTIAADSAFGVALVTLWQRVAQSGVVESGFAADAERSSVATQAAAALDAVKKGWALAASVTADRTLAGCAVLRLGFGARSRTAELFPLLIDPDHGASGYDTQLVEQLRSAAGAREIDRWSATVAAGSPIEEFLGRIGFVRAGLLPDWWAAGGQAAVLVWTRPGD